MISHKNLSSYPLRLHQPLQGDSPVHYDKLRSQEKISASLELQLATFCTLLTARSESRNPINLLFKQDHPDSRPNGRNGTEEEI